MLFLELFITFFQIGLFGFGGGYAMLSMIQGEVVTGHHWISSSEFTDIGESQDPLRLPLLWFSLPSF